MHAGTESTITPEIRAQLKSSIYTYLWLKDRPDPLAPLSYRDIANQSGTSYSKIPTDLGRLNRLGMISMTLAPNQDRGGRKWVIRVLA